MGKTYTYPGSGIGVKLKEFASGISHMGSGHLRELLNNSETPQAIKDEIEKELKIRKAKGGLIAKPLGAGGKVK
jgi:hypothetical protein